MATALEPVDVEDALRADLSTDALPVCAPPVPRDLERRFPCAVIERVGGARVNAVLDSHDLTASVWAGTWAQAMARANALAGAIARLESTVGASGVQWRTARPVSLPANAPDPLHPNIPRVQFTANVTCRATL